MLHAEGRLSAVAGRVTVPATGFAALVAAAAASLIGFAALRPPDFFDLRVYRFGSLALVHGEALYRLHGPAGLSYTYPPFAALVMLPLALPGLGLADALSLLINVAALGSIVAMCLRVALRDRVARRQVRVLVVLLVAVGLVLDPVQQTLSFGQVNLVLWALLTREVLRLDTGRWRGIGIGIATATKLTPGLFVVYLLLRGRWADARRALVTFAACTVGVFALFPSVSADFWFRAVLDPGRIGGVDYVGNQSLLGALTRLAEPRQASRLVWVTAVVVVLAAWAFAVRRTGPGDDLRGLWLTGVCAALVSPITWTHHLIWVVPFLVDLGVVAAVRRKRGVAVVTALALLAFASHVPWHFAHDRGRHWADGVLGQVVESAYVLLMVLTLAAYAVVRRRTSRSALSA